MMNNKKKRKILFDGYVSQSVTMLPGTWFNINQIDVVTDNTTLITNLIDNNQKIFN